MKPIVAIVGRPNVGKSTLFNRISRERRSLVNDTPGVTRDRIYHAVVWNEKPFILIDTGGFEPDTKEPLLARMRAQTELAIHEADVIVFLMDVRDGLTPSDRDTADLLRGTSKPLHFVVNKVDGERHEPSAMEFYELGPKDLHRISAKHGRGVSDLLDAVTRDFPSVEVTPADEAPSGIRIAVIGRPNVGKSSLVNRLCGEERALVSPVPGTTHDAVDAEVRWYGKRFVILDTAGIRRKSKTKVPLEKYCVIQALRSIERCHVTLLLLDATEGVTDQDSRIGSYILDRGRGCAILLNKWDLVSKDHRTHDAHIDRIKEGLPHLDFAPVLTVSALTGQRVGRLLALVEEVYASCGCRLPTPILNQKLRMWIDDHPPPMRRRRRLKLYYMTQPKIYPPTFVAFANAPDDVPTAYRRYLVNRLREEFDFSGAPIRLLLKARE